MDPEKGALHRAEFILDMIDFIEGYPIKQRLLLLNIRELQPLNTGLSQKDLTRRNTLLAKSYHKSGRVFLETGTGDLGLDYLFSAKEIADKIDDDRIKLEIASDISNLFHRQGQLEESLKYQEICHELSIQIGDSSEACVLINNMGVIQSELGNHFQAIQSLTYGYHIATEVGDKKLQGMCLNNLGGSLGHLAEFDSAMVKLNRALILFREIKDHEWEGLTLAKLAKVYGSSNDPDHNLVLDYGEAALRIGDSLENMDIQRRALNVLHVTYDRLGQHDKAYVAYQRYEKVKAVLRGESQKIEAVQRQAQYEIEKQSAIERDRAKQQVAIAEANEQKKEILNYALIAGSFFLLLFIVLIIHRLRVVKKQKHLIERQNEERKLLLKEIHHRIKNNFQVVSSLLRLQANEENNKKIAQAFDDAVLRIQSMASVHELIYKQEMFEALDIRSYLDRLVGSIQSYSTDDRVSISVDTNIEKLNIKTLVPIGITINELVTNSLKYAFNETSEEKPEIQLSLTDDKQSGFKLMYRDNGSGFNQARSNESFGIELIETVIEQIDGTMEQRSTPDWKNSIEIRFREMN